MQQHSPCGGLSVGNFSFGSVVVSRSMSPLFLLSTVGVSGAEGAILSGPSSSARVVGEGGSVFGGTSGASVGAGGGGGGTGNTRTVELGPDGWASSSPAELGAVVEAVVVFTVVGTTTVGASVASGLGEVGGGTVSLRKGAAGGSVGLAVTFGGPCKEEDETWSFVGIKKVTK